MPRSKNSLTPTQEAAIVALMQHATAVEAARAVGVTPRTLRRWLTENHDFKAALKAARDECFENAKSLLQQRMTEAAARLGQIINDDTAPHASSVAACRATIELGMRIREVDVDQRIAELERMAVELAARRPVQ